MYTIYALQCMNVTNFHNFSVKSKTVKEIVAKCNILQLWIEIENLQTPY
jgi:hypothetical protein